jgi:hypothetical protein
MNCLYFNLKIFCGYEFVEALNLFNDVLHESLYADQPVPETLAISSVGTNRKLL